MGWRGNKPGPSIGNFGINFSGPGQNFMRNLNPFRWAGALIDNPLVSGAWGLLSSPFSGMSNLRQGMTQQEWEDARNERIRNKRIQNILGRKAPITDMTLKNLTRLGYTGEMPDVGSTGLSRAIAKDFKREGDDITYARSHLASLGDKMSTKTAKGIPFVHDLEASAPVRGTIYPSRSSEGIQKIADLNNMGYDFSDIKGYRADINMPVSGLVNYDQYLENVADWPDLGLKEQFEEEGLTTPESQKQFFDVFGESLKEQSRGLKRNPPKISTDEIQKAIDAGLIMRS